MSKVAPDCFPVEVRGSARRPLGMAPTRFLRDYWQKRPLLIRDAFDDFVPSLSPDDLAGLACTEDALSRIVLREHPPSSSFRGRAQRGARNPALAPTQKLDCGSPLRGLRNDEKWTVRGGPFQESDFSKLPRSHWTLLVQDVDKWDADVAALLDHFDFLPSWRIDDVMVSYATDGGGVGAHVDQYDVFLLQGMGQRRWRIDTDPRAPRDFRDDVDLKLLRGFRPTHEWALDPGDMLYLPPGVPHEGVAIGECMTFSIGMRAPSSAELLVAFAEQVAAGQPESLRYSDPDLETANECGEIDDDALHRARVALGAAAQMMDAETLADFFGRFITAYRSVHALLPPKRKTSAEKLAAELPRSTFQSNPWSRFAWRRTGGGAVLYASGEQYDCPLAWARVLCKHGRALEGAQLAKLPSRGEGVKLLTDLINAGDLSRKPR
ncbi:MAG: JmjC domain-containing protein [Rhodanobacteraceae bacterium]